MTPLQNFGVAGERWVYNKAKSLGYTVKWINNFNEPCHDLTINGLPVEVKTANKTYRLRTLSTGSIKQYQRWQWHISDTADKHKGDYGLVLLAKDRGEFYPFILPGSAVNDRPHLQLTSHPLVYSGWMSQWLNRWEILTYLANGIYQDNGPMFQEWLNEQREVA